MGRKVAEAVKDGNYEVIRDLTPKEVLWFDALNADLVAQEKAFEVAFNYYMNKVSDTRERLEGFYETVSGISRYDATRGIMGVTQVEGRVCLVKVEDE